VAWHDYQQPTTPHPTTSSGDQGVVALEVRCRGCSRTKAIHHDPSRSAARDTWRELGDLFNPDR
jgi:hypothetical protein